MKSFMRHLPGVLPVALLAVALGSSAVLAQPAEGEGGGPGRHGRGPDGDKRGKMVQELGLTQEQAAQLAQMRQTNQAAAETLREALKSAQTGLREALSQYDADPATVQNYATQVKTAQAQLVDHRVASVTQLKAILTPEQFAKMQEKAKERRKNARNGREGKGKFGGQGRGRSGGGFWGGGRGPQDEDPQETE